MSKIKYLIVSTPLNNKGTSGGTIVLHNLCNLLNKLGENAKMFYIKGINYKNDKIIKRNFLSLNVFNIKIIFKSFVKRILRKNVFSYLKIKFKFFSKPSKNTIVVYPDIVYGNLLNAKLVVRWFLYYNRFNEDAYGKDDLFFCYREVFNDKKLNPNCYKLYTPFFDFNLYRQYNFGERSGKCYIIRKGENRTDLPSKYDGIIIDGKSEEEIVKIFNECEMCISYDTQTAYSSIAAICGCISIVIPEKGKTKLDYLGPNGISYGVGWGLTENEIKFSKETRDLRIEYYKELNNQSIKSVKDFICIIDKVFKWK